MRSILKNKKAGYFDIFLFIILSVAVVFIAVIFVKMGNEVSTKLHDKMDVLQHTIRPGENSSINYSRIITENLGETNVAYTVLQWVTVIIIIGMMLAILLGNFLVQTKPAFFVPYILIIIIAVILSVNVSNAYDEIMRTTDLASTFALFGPANWIILHLPIFVAVIGIAGGVIMFARMQHSREAGYE